MIVYTYDYTIDFERTLVTFWPFLTSKPWTDIRNLWADYLSAENRGALASCVG